MYFSTYVWLSPEFIDTAMSRFIYSLLFALEHISLMLKGDQYDVLH